MGCIYCRGEGPFTDEHVLQRAFGANAVLCECVCSGCNAAFSAIDKSFVDAVDFYHLGKNMLRRLGLGLSVGPDGVALYARRRADGFAEHPPQFVELAPNEWRFTASTVGAFDVVVAELGQPGRLSVTARTVRDDGTRARRHIVRSAPHTYLVEGTEAASVEALRAEMMGAGLSVGSLGTPQPHQYEGHGPPLKFDTSLDLQSFGRALAKIALNFVCHRHGSEIASSTAFDDVRAFARYGVGDLWKFIKPSVLMGMDNKLAEPWVTGPQHVLILVRDGSGPLPREAVFVVVGGKFIGTVLLQPDGVGPGGLLPGTWLVSRCDPELHIWDDMRMPDDAFRAIINPAAIGLQAEWDAVTTRAGGPR